MSRRALGVVMTMAGVGLLTARGVSLDEGRRSSMAINRDKWIVGERCSSLLASGGDKLGLGYVGFGAEQF